MEQDGVKPALITLELPLLLKVAETWSSLTKALKPLVNTSINQVNTGINRRKTKPYPLILNELEVRSPGFEPGSRAWRARVLDQALRFDALDDDRYQMVEEQVIKSVNS